ncbi:MAG: TonB-dependent receptor [Saprospiraceae bacterium]|nr:TonB-dependent receptor [Saprospiraceae bacterium]MBK8852945.1 TonB-dependent receptor [Saprospiraceae bacterium]
MKNLILLVFIIFYFPLSSQVVSGLVQDNTGLPLIGVSVSEKGTSNGTITDIDGMYFLETRTKNPVLIFSYTGYTSIERSVEGITTLNIVMEEGILLGEVQVVGSRSYNRSSTNSPVAVDVIEIAQLANTTGRVEVNQILQFSAPSFNATKQSGSDGADHIDPASLRGLGPDQTLVLINGKRRHQSSLVNIFGTRGRGNTGTDLNAIPAAAIKRIEILRDGASAQYGSDAIAGVINVVLKDKTYGLTGGVTYGLYSTDVGGDYAEKSGEEIFNTNGKNRALDPDGDKKYDGNTTRVDLNYGVSLGNKGGFANFTAEYLTKDRTLRPGYSWRKGYGSAAVDQFQFFVNSAYSLGEKSELYIFGGRGNRDTDAFAFSRSEPSADEPRTVAALYPNGFTPRITSNIIDQSFTGGLRHEMSNGWQADFSHNYGFNNFHYLIKNTNNASLGSASPREFDAGGHSLAMNITGLNFSKYYKKIASGLNLAFGTEYRTENFQIFAGETGSYATYDVNGIAITNPASQQPFVNEFGVSPGGGSQGFPGYSPGNEVNKSRSNIGFYGDAELNVTSKWLISGALRYENYSDFGNTLNYKVASRYNIFDDLAIRASVSSGFRAPSLAQIHYNLIFTNIVAGKSLQTLLASNTSTVAKSFGIESLQEEKANNLAAGLTYKKGGFTVTVDGYIIDVKDRIILTDVFDVSELNVGAEAAQFFANGVNTRTTGLDVILNYKYNLSKKSSLTGGIAGNFNKTEIQKINNGNLNPFTFYGPFSQAYLKAAAPDYKVGVNLMYQVNKFDAMLTYTQFSQVVLQDFQWVDSPPSTQSEADELFKTATDTYKAAGTLDLSVSYNITGQFKVTLGGNNILNTYPTPQFDGWTDQGGFNDSVQMGSDGRYLFARLGFTF